MRDLISRQAALDAMETWDKFGCDPDGKLVRYDDDKHYIPYVHYEDMVHAIKHLPSAQPEINCSEFPNNSDTISRQAAIVALDKRFDSIPMEQTTEILLLRKDLRNLPSAQPQRKKGEWVLQSDDYHEYYECDQCGIAVGLDDVRNFCPNCGADMRGEKE